jgi:type I restriction enzyme S subunit
MTTLPDGWQVHPLAEVAAVTLGQSPPGHSYNVVGDGVPFFQGKTEFTSKYAEVRKYTTAGTKFAKADDILVSVRAPVGPTNLAPVDCAIGRGLAGLRAKDGIDQKYLQWAMRATEHELASHGVGTTFPAVTGKQLKAHPIPVPPTLAEQHRIVELLEDHLSRLDAATASLRDSIRRLDVLRRLVVKEIAVGDSVPLRQLAVDSGYGTSVKCEVGGAGPAVVRIPNLVGGRIDLTDEKRAVDPSVDLSRSMLVPGDVLIIRTNGSKELIGRSGVVQEHVDAAFASYLIRYRVDPRKLRAEWLHTMLGSPGLRRKIERLAASSAGQHNLSLGKLDGLQIPAPTLEDQDAALARLAELDAQLGAMRQALNVSLRRSESLRRSLLAAAFSGRLTDTTSVRGRG